MLQIIFFDYCQRPIIKYIGVFVLSIAITMEKTLGQHLILLFF